MREPVPHSLIAALELLRVPALADVLRKQSTLPDDVTVIVRIAGGCEETSRSASEALNRPVSLLVKASRFYLEQVVFYPAEDSYRVLGLTPDAPQEKIREHGRWLMRWLHPDNERTEWETVYASRITTAWDDLKTPSRRADYDRSHAALFDQPAKKPVPVRFSLPLIAVRKKRVSERSSRLSRRPVAGGLMVLCFWLIPVTVENAPPPRVVSDNSCADLETLDGSNCLSEELMLLGRPPAEQAKFAP